jgi:copper chaperone CopZ
MARLLFKVGHVYCYDCVKALGKFIGRMKGVQSVEVKNNDSAVIEYEPSALDFDEEKFKQIVIESIDKLGFRIKEY